MPFTEFYKHNLLVVNKSLRPGHSVKSIMVIAQHPFISNVILTTDGSWEYKLKERSFFPISREVMLVASEDLTVELVPCEVFDWN